MKLKFKKATMISAVAILGVVGAGVAIASGSRGPEHKLRWVERVVTHKLDLDDSQQEKLGQVKAAVLEAKARHRTERSERFSAVEQLILSEELDEDVVNQLLTQHRDRLDQEIPAILETVREFHGSLSDEQKQKAVEAVREMRKRHGH